VLVGRQLQVTVTLRASEPPPGTPLVLADAAALSRLEAREVEKRQAASGALLAFAGPGDEAHFARLVDAIFTPERRMLSVAAPVPLVAALRAHGEAVDVHLATAWPERASRVRIRLPAEATRGARKAVFRMSDGTKTTLRLATAGDRVTADLPTFTGYAVLTPES
jgi:hypothetical protein